MSDYRIPLLPRSVPVGCHPPRDSQPSDGENDPTPTPVRDTLAVGISNIVNVERLCDQCIQPTFCKRDRWLPLPTPPSRSQSRSNQRNR